MQRDAPATRRPQPRNRPPAPAAPAPFRRRCPHWTVRVQAVAAPPAPAPAQPPPAAGAHEPRAGLRSSGPRPRRASTATLPPAPQAAAPPSPAPSEDRWALKTGLGVTWLGTSSGAPTVVRNVSCTLVRQPDRMIMVDCGEGTHRQLLQTGLDVSQVRRRSRCQAPARIVAPAPGRQRGSLAGVALRGVRCDAPPAPAGPPSHPPPHAAAGGCHIHHPPARRPLLRPGKRHRPAVRGTPAPARGSCPAAAHLRAPRPGRVPARRAHAGGRGAAAAGAAGHH